MKQVQSALASLPREMRDKAERTCLKAGGEIILAKAKANVPVRHGMLKISLANNVKKNKEGELSSRIGPRSEDKIAIGVHEKGKNKGKPKYIRPQKYSHLVEYGTSHSAANPFMRPAAESSKDQVLTAMMANYQKRLDKIARAAMKKGGKK